jgi:hypothetical protein
MTFSRLAVTYLVGPIQIVSAKVVSAVSAAAAAWEAVSTAAAVVEKEENQRQNARRVVPPVLNESKQQQPNVATPPPNPNAHTTPAVVALPVVTDISLFSCDEKFTKIMIFYFMPLRRDFLPPFFDLRRLFLCS